jgi:hypothetical protein
MNTVPIRIHERNPWLKKNVDGAARKASKWSTHIQNTGNHPLLFDPYPCVYLKNVSNYNAEILTLRNG